MENIKSKIFDFVYDELDESHRDRIWQEIKSDEELLEYYHQLKAEAALLDKSIFDQADDSLLESQRELLAETIAPLADNFGEKMNKGNVVPLLQKVFNVAAVVLITFFVTQKYYGGGGANDAVSPDFSGFPGEGSGTILPVSYQTGSDGIFSSDDYDYKNLVVDDKGENMKLSFDISTRKVVEGEKNDPLIMYTLNKILKGNDDPGVKLRTMRAIDRTGDEKLQATLIVSMLHDDNAAVRKKALKVLTKGTINDNIKDALLTVVEKDDDQVLRIEALNALEKIDEKTANKALKMVEGDDNEYLRYRASLMDE